MTIVYKNKSLSDRSLPRVLIVDDMPSNIQILAQTLMKSYVIQIAASGQAALDLLQDSEKPDLILLDVMMPGIDGYEVCRRIKQNAYAKDIPIIFVTASSSVDEQYRGFRLGAVDYIAKPFDMSLVIARVGVHIRLKQKSDLLEKLAFLDGLTDISNRRALDETLTQELARAKRTNNSISVLMIDIDHFKAFNDHYGHGSGDECLRNVAQAIQHQLQRPGDFVGRYGGEEFLIILPNCNAQGATKIAERTRICVLDQQIPHAYSSVADCVSVSIGYISQQQPSDMTSDEILKAADEALYRAKEGGRNQICGKVTGGDENSNKIQHISQ